MLICTIELVAGQPKTDLSHARCRELMVVRSLKALLHGIECGFDVCRGLCNEMTFDSRCCNLRESQAAKNASIQIMLTISNATIFQAIITRSFECEHKKQLNIHEHGAYIASDVKIIN